MSSDLYSLGATLIHLLARKPPAQMLGLDLAIDLERTMVASSETKLFLAQLVARRADERFPSAAAALAGLDALTGMTVYPSIPQPSKRRAAAAVGFLGACLVAAMLFARPVSAPESHPLSSRTWHCRTSNR